jgi:hypothetical protein
MQENSLVQETLFKNTTNQHKHFFKGTVSRDFRLLVFFMNQFPPSPGVYRYGRFKFFRKFVEIFAAQGAPQASLTTVANGKNLQSEKFALFLLDTFG